MTTNTPNHPFFRTAAVTAASDTKFAGAIVLAQPVPMRVAACVAGGIVLALVLLLTCGHYTRTARVSGLLSPAAGSVKVFAAGFARITRSFVANDAPVVAGQPLFSINLYLIRLLAEIASSYFLSVMQSRDEKRDVFGGQAGTQFAAVPVADPIARAS